MELMEVIEGVRRGSAVYVYEGFIYLFNRANKGVTFFKCQRKGCKGRGKVDGKIFSILFEHGHETEELRIKKLRLKEHLKKKATLIAGNNISCSMRKIFNDACEELDLAEPVIEFESVKAALYRRRKSALPPVPSNLQEYASALQEFCHWGTTLDDTPRPFYRSFLQDEAKGCSAVIFSSPTFSNLLSKSKRVVLDTSFKAIPRNLKPCELLIIHGFYMEHSFPTVFILISRGSKESDKLYWNVRVLDEVLTNICPKSKTVAELVVSDHEKSIRDAAILAWPKANHVSSLFHYAQAIYHMHSTLNLTNLTACNTFAAKALRLLMVWTFLPASELINGLNEITIFLRSHRLEQSFAEMMTYMNDYWVTTVGVLSASVFNQDHMISFEVENFFHLLVDRMGPIAGVWEFTSKLRDLEHSLALDIEKLRYGQPIIRPRRAFIVKLNDTIRESVMHMELGKFSNRVFLDRISKIVKYLESKLRRPQYPVSDSDFVSSSKTKLVSSTNVKQEDVTVASPEEFMCSEVEYSEVIVTEDGDHAKQENVEEDEMFLPITISNQKYEESNYEESNYEKSNYEESNYEESNYEESNCISCLLNKPVYSVTSCGHMNLCGACRDSHKESGIFDQEGLELEMCCPRCRTPVTCQ